MERLRALVGLALSIVVWCAGLVEVAGATHDGTTAPACFASPDGSETMPATTSDSARELRNLRRETIGLCRVNAYWLAHQAAIAHGSELRLGPTGPIAARLDDVKAGQAVPRKLAYTSSDPLPVNGPPTPGPTGPMGPAGSNGGSDSDPMFVKLNTDSAGLVTETGRGVYSGLWLLLGGGFGIASIGALLRKVGA